MENGTNRRLSTTSETRNNPYIDHIVFKKRNPIICKSLCMLLAVVVYGCMVVDAWAWTFTASNDAIQKTKKCLYGEGSEGVCTFGIFVSFVALLAAIVFLGGEFVVERIAVVQYRLQYYFVESVFSAIWAFLFLICFLMLETQWIRGDVEAGIELSEIEKEGAESSVRAAIWFSFFSIPVWAFSGYTALQRYRIMRAELEYNAALAGRRPSAYPATITSFTNAPSTTGTTTTSPPTNPFAPGGIALEIGGEEGDNMTTSRTTASF